MAAAFEHENNLGKIIMSLQRTILTNELLNLVIKKSEDSFNNSIIDERCITD